MELENSNNQKPDSLQRLQELTERAKQGDASVLPELRETLRNSPEVWQHFGNVARHAERAWIDAIVADNLCVKEGLEQQLAELREEMLREGNSCTEKMLVQRVLNSWLQVTYYELALATVTGKLLKTHEKDLQRRLDGAHRRHLFAVRTLEEVRTLMKKRNKNLKHVDPVRVRAGNDAEQAG